MENTIFLIYNNESKENEDSDKLLTKFNKSPESKSDARTSIMKSIKDSKPKYLCGICKKPVYLCGGLNQGKTCNGKSFRHLYFKHYYRQPDCPLYIKSIFTKNQIERIKFHGQKEGLAHIKLKQIINEALKSEGYNVYVEKRISLKDLCRNFDSDEWRKPDIRAKKGDLCFVMEVQLATTFLSVILDRMDFYKKVHNYLLWVLEKFDPQQEQKFTNMDILSLNNRNIFVLDEEMQLETIRSDKLTLKCYYEEPNLDFKGKIYYKLNEKPIIAHIEDIIFDDEHYIGYCYDCKKEEDKLKLKWKSTNITSELIKYRTPIEKFIYIVRSEIVNLYTKENSSYIDLPTDMMNNDWEKIERKLNAISNENPPVPNDNFFKSLLSLYSADGEYNNLIRVLLFSYNKLTTLFPFNFRNTNDLFEFAWNLSIDYKQLCIFLDLYSEYSYNIPDATITEYSNGLQEHIHTQKYNTKLDAAERYTVEKYILIIMYYKIENQNNSTELFGLFKEKTPNVIRAMIMLASYSIGHPLCCELHNIQSLSCNVFLNSNKEFAHLAIKMINNYGWKDKIKTSSYDKLSAASSISQNYKYDNLAKILFKKLRT